jgi:hypothetical protein
MEMSKKELTLEEINSEITMHRDALNSLYMQQCEKQREYQIQLENEFSELLNNFKKKHEQILEQFILRFETRATDEIVLKLYHKSEFQY